MMSASACITDASRMCLPMHHMRITDKALEWGREQFDDVQGEQG